MTLTELKYIVAVAREKHFGRAAEACYVSQPTLSVAVKKLEEELDVKLFERSASEVSVTPLGEEIVRQAQSVLEQAASIKEIAKRGKDPLAGPLKLGIIYTIGPYLLPDLVRQAIARTPQMPLMLQENFTQRLLEMLRIGELDCAIMAEPFPDTGLAVALTFAVQMVASPTTAVVVAAGQPTTGIDAVLPDTGQPGPAQLVFLNRCAPIGCVVHGGNESAINNTSSIVTGTRNLSPYAWGDASFAALAQCVRETFAPYQVTITTTDPGNVPHREHMVAGTPAEAGFSNGVAGVSPFTCGSIPNSISFTFANVIGDDIHELCWTAAQEIAHGFGLDHEVNPPDAMSYIDAPTTKRFTPDTVACGEFSPRACACGGNTQNSNALLLRAVGGNPNLFANGFEDAAATANDAWKSYRSPFPKLMHAEPLGCGVDPVGEIAKHRQ